MENLIWSRPQYYTLLFMFTTSNNSRRVLRYLRQTALKLWTVYHGAEQEVRDSPLFPHVEIWSHSARFKSQRICHSLHGWRLYVVHSSSTNLPFGIDIDPNRLKHIRRMCNFKHVRTRRQHCRKSAIVSAMLKKTWQNRVKLWNTMQTLAYSTNIAVFRSTHNTLY